MSNKVNLLFVTLAIAFIAPVLAAEEMGTVSYKHFIWNNLSLMYFFDIAVILLISYCIFALYSIYNFLTGELKSAYTYLLVGTAILGALHMIDLIAMATNKMEFMEYLHLNIGWIITLAALIAMCMAFYKIKSAVQKVRHGK